MQHVPKMLIVQAIYIRCLQNTSHIKRRCPVAHHYARLDELLSCPGEQCVCGCSDKVSLSGLSSSIIKLLTRDETVV